MKALQSFETLGNTHTTMQCPIPEYWNHHQYCCEILLKKKNFAATPLPK